MGRKFVSKIVVNSVFEVYGIVWIEVCFCVIFNVLGWFYCIKFNDISSGVMIK